LIEKRSHGQIVCPKRAWDSSDDEIDLTVAQSREVAINRARLGHVNRNTGILRAELLDRRRQQPAGMRLRTPDPKFTCRRISERLNLSETLLELIDNDHGPAEQRLSIGGQFHAAPASIEQWNAERSLQLGYGARNGRLRNSEVLSRL